MSNDLKSTSALTPPRETVHLDPARVRVGGINPRAYDELAEKDVRELADMMRTVGQTTAILVRRIYDDPNFEFELIAGARRHKAGSLVRAEGKEHADFLLRAEVIEADDAEAARLAEAENRARVGISAHERGTFLKHRLEHDYSGVQRALAEAMTIETGLLSRLIALAEWDERFVSAWGDRRLVTVQDAVAIEKHYSDASKRTALLDEAARIAAEQDDKRRDGKAYIRPTEVRRRLLDAIGARKAEVINADAAGAKGIPLLVVRSKTKKGLSLYVHEGDEVRQKAIVAALQKALEKLPA